uniref:Peptidase S1 domain-containing protein n=1 Tax=Anopheles coluzzii TaxID=1518534 RepID=A0A8W7PIE1_ANOCL
MAFSLRIGIRTTDSKRCLVLVVLVMLLTVLACLPPSVEGNFPVGKFRRCNNNKGICVSREQCLNGQINTVGHTQIEPRLLNDDDIDECDVYGMQCCNLPSTNVPADSDEEEQEEEEKEKKGGTVTTTTTEEPDDPDWSRQCGQRTDVTERADQDGETNRFEFPWSVALFSKAQFFGKVRKEFLCGGTLIDDYLVLTAARCVNQKDRNTLVVQLGRWDLDAGKESRMQEIAVEELIIHRGYVLSSHRHNVALLVLANGAQLGRAANRVCLPDHSVQFGPDTLCYVVGWSNSPSPNTSNRQLKLRSMVAPVQECTATIRRSTGAWDFRLLSENICTTYLDDTVPCERAPGSGFVCESPTLPGQYFLVGIASYAVRQCHKYRAHDVFVHVPDYIEWVDGHVVNQSRQTSFYRPDPISFD